MHQGHRIGRGAEGAGDGATGAFPGGEEAVTASDRGLEVPGHRVDLDASCDREMVLFAVAGELGERVGVLGGEGEIAGGEVHFGGHQQEVVELEPGRRVEWQRLEHLASTAQRPRARSRGRRV